MFLSLLLQEEGGAHWLVHQVGTQVAQGVDHVLRVLLAVLGLLSLSFDTARSIRNTPHRVGVVVLDGGPELVFRRVLIKLILKRLGGGNVLGLSLSHGLPRHHHHVVLLVVVQCQDLLVHR